LVRTRHIQASISGRAVRWAQVCADSRDVLTLLRALNVNDLLLLEAGGCACHVNVYLKYQHKVVKSTKQKRTMNVRNAQLARISQASRSRSRIALVDVDGVVDVGIPEILKGDVADVACASSSGRDGTRVAAKDLDSGAVLRV
jgi:hypothetical protein